MTPTPGITVTDVSKRFILTGRVDTVREMIPALVRSAVGRRREPPVEHWALRDVSFSVGPGEALGLIGPNGAGKSTLLRLLTRILRPTTGRVDVVGRIGALIELTAGFHFDLSARDNVFLQGAILGMRRREIARRFDAIIDFAGVHEFVDVPLKRYSSGMVARLGFAIAAHLDTEILLIDEVLAVGDQAFQRKAVAHLQGLVKDGRPVVMVSHQLERIAELCSRALLVRAGRVVASGTPDECIAAYLAADSRPAGTDDGRPFAISAISLAPGSSVASGDRVTVRVHGVASRRDPGCETTVGVRVRALPSEESVFATHATACGLTLPAAGEFEVEVALDMNVGPGLYRVEAMIGEPVLGRDWARGPSALLRVARHESAYGRVYMNPVMTVVPLVHATRSRAHREPSAVAT